jgi:ABC-2 type transport system permease protein
MMGFTVLLQKELREQLRTGRLVAVAAVFILFGLLGPLADRYMKELLDALAPQAGSLSTVLPAPSLAGDAAQILKNLTQFGIVCALLLTMGTVAWEKERGTAGLILTKPASRAAFLAAKLAAISLNLAVATILGCGIAWVYTALLYPASFPVGGYLAMMLVTWWMLVEFVAITLLGSTLTRSAIAAAGIGLVAMIVLGIIGALPTIGPYMPSSLVAVAMDLCLGRNTGDIAGPILFNVALVPALFGAAWLSFRRQEL